MSRSRRGRFATVTGALLALAVGFSACGNATQKASSGGSGDPGVTSNSITVGSIANVTGPLSSGFAPIVNGVEAYFSMINAEGGVDGRKLKLAYQEDDQGSPTVDLTVAQQLVARRRVRRGGGGDAVLRWRQVPRPAGGAHLRLRRVHRLAGPAFALRRLRLGAVLPVRRAGRRLPGPATGRPVHRRGRLRRAPVGRRLLGRGEGHAPGGAQRLVHRPEPRLRRGPHP